MKRTNTTTDRKGQAAVEAAIGLFVFAFVVAAFVAFAELFINGFEMMQYARRDAGEGALHSENGASGGGSAAAFASAADPTGQLQSSPWAYPASRFSGGRIFGWQGGVPNALELVNGEKTEDFEIDLRLGGQELFPDGFQLKEKALVPPMGGL